MLVGMRRGREWIVHTHRQPTTGFPVSPETQGAQKRQNGWRRRRRQRRRNKNGTKTATRHRTKWMNMEKQNGWKQHRNSAPYPNQMAHNILINKLLYSLILTRNNHNILIRNKYNLHYFSLSKKIIISLDSSFRGTTPYILPCSWMIAPAIDSKE